MAVARHLWMFRTAAVVYLVLGGSWLWTATMSGKWAESRPILVGLGMLALTIGILLFRRTRLAIALSAVGAAIVSICAAFAAPQMRGPGILVVAVLALLSGLYAALAARELFGRGA